MNADLQARVEEAIKLSSVKGINVADAGFGFALLPSSRSAKTIAALNPMQALRRIKVDGDRYRYIPLDGVRLSKIGTDSDDYGGSVEWYSVERPDGLTFAIAHTFNCGHDDGACAYDLVSIPEYLLISKGCTREKQVA
jgi:hypothetical protein